MIVFHNKDNIKHAVVGDAIKLPELTIAEVNALSNLETDTIVNQEGVLKKYDGDNFVDLVPVRIANASGDFQFQANSGQPIRFAGSGDTSVSFDSATRTIIITSTEGSGSGGEVTSFNGRDGAVVSQSGDYNTNQVTESGNLYFTNARVRSTTLTGFTIGSNIEITSGDTILSAFEKVQGQISNRVPFSRTINSGMWLQGGGNLSSDRTISLRPTINSWLLDAEDNPRLRFGGQSNTVNGILLRQSNNDANFDLNKNDDSTYFRINSNGAIVIGSVPWDRLTNHISISAGSGLTGGGTLSNNINLSVNFGTSSNTVAEGNDSRILNGLTAFSWGDHSQVGYAFTGTGNSQVRTNAQLDGRFILSAGDTMTGNLAFNSINGRSLVFNLGARLRATIEGLILSSETGTDNRIILRPKGDLNSDYELDIRENFLRYGGNEILRLSENTEQQVFKVWVGTQGEYDSISTKQNDTIYHIVED